MSGKMDMFKGRLKEALGALSDDDELREEGQMGQVVGKAKMAANGVVKKMQFATDQAIDEACGISK